MKFKRQQLAFCRHAGRCFVAILCSFLLMPGDVVWAAALQQDQAAQDTAAKLPPEQLDSLVAPIALYPDPLLSQALVASTYPLEIIQLQQWLEKNKGLKDKALTDAVMKQGWDPSIQAMATLPDMVKELAGNITWTTDLGNAFLAQQNDVMDAVQRMRSKAQSNGNLKSTEQQKVEVQTVEQKQVIVIQPANPEVIYVPSYNPTVVYGAPVYPYPPIAYPPVGYYAAGAAISFGVGMMVGAAMSGGWGWGCGWGGNNNVTINNNNNFVSNSNRNNIQGGNRAQPRGNSNWQHNAQHRGGAPYPDRSTANKFGGTARGDSLQNRQANARQNTGANRGPASGNRGGNTPSVGNMDRGNRGGSTPSAGTMDRGNRGGGGTPSAGTMDRGGGANRGAAAAGGDRVGNRSVSSSPRSSGSGAFGGGSGSSARASSSRGSSSFGGGGRSSGGGGGRSSGGGRRR
jgi:Protein of unknown function (DUF3300)